MVRSSMIFIGAAKEPARNNKAVSLASAEVMLPEICTRPPVIGSLMLGAVTTSDLPWSFNTMAMRLFLLARVRSAKMSEPALSSTKFTEGWLFSVKPGWASLMLSPVNSTCLLTKVEPWPPELDSNS